VDLKKEDFRFLLHFFIVAMDDEGEVDAKLLKEMIDATADITLKDDAYGNTPLHVACSMEKKNALQAVLERAKTSKEELERVIQAENKEGNSPIAAVRQKVKWLKAQEDQSEKVQASIGRLEEIAKILEQFN